MPCPKCNDKQRVIIYQKSHHCQETDHYIRGWELRLHAIKEIAKRGGGMEIGQANKKEKKKNKRQFPLLYTSIPLAKSIQF